MLLASFLFATNYVNEILLGASIATRKQVPRGKSLGKGLDSLSRGLGTKIPIQISEGKRGPEPPIQAAKLASEGGIILKQHIPIYPHWKNYKKDEGQITNYIGKLVVSQFQF